MGSLTGCLAKAGKNVSRADKDAIMARAKALRDEGTAAADAAMMAVDEQIAAVRALITELSPDEQQDAQIAEVTKLLEGMGEKVEAAVEAAPQAKTSSRAQTRDGVAALFQEALEAGQRGAGSLSNLVSGPAFLRQLGQAVNVPSDTGATGEAAQLVDSDATASEGRLNRVRSHAKALTDILGSGARAKQGGGGFDVKTQRLVLPHVLALGQDSQVLQSVVQLVPVDVVNDLVARQLAPESLFNDAAMVKLAVAGNLGDSVSLLGYAADTFVRSVALAGAEVSSAGVGTNLERPAGNVGAAGGALNGDLRHGLDDTRNDGIQSRADGAGNVALFSRSRAPTGVPLPDAKAMVAAIREALPTAPPIQIHDSVKKAPEALRRKIREASADADVEAAYHDGEIHVFPGNIASIERMQFVVAHHEVRHHGLRSMMGPSLGPAMLRMYATNPNLKAAADKKVSDGLAGTRILAVEEALADLSVEDMQKVTGWERIVAAVRQWLRQAAANLRRAGLTLAADAIEPNGWTDADIASLVQKAEDVSRGKAAPFRTGGTVFGRDESPEQSALKALSENDELFALEKAAADTVEGVAAQIDPEIKVKQSFRMGSRTDYQLTMPDGKTARLMVREPNPFGPDVYGFDTVDGESQNMQTERPGENPDDVPPTGDVWLDVSLLTGGSGGAKAYAIAAGFAHNTGRIFIGDPAGLSADAMRRRSENMLSSALRYGTTKHLAPHPRQVAGDPAIGVPPLKWVYGDDLGNIRRLIALNLKAMENAGLDDTSIRFDPAAGVFRDSEGNVLTRDDVDALAAQTNLGDRAIAGGRTVARGAVLRALSREEGRAGAVGGRRDGLLADVARLGSDSPAAVKALFSRSPTEAIREVVPQHVQDYITDRLTSQRGFNRGWHRTVGSQLHKAKINKEFGRVFYAVQDFMKDVSRVATRAADQAPDMLPQIDTLTDLAKLAPTLASPKAYKSRKADIKAASDALFDGTLRYTRDEDGEAVLVDPDSGELGGIVWSDAELKARGMSDKAITMYRQSRKAIDTSLDNLLASDVYRTAAFMEPSLLAGTPAEHRTLLDGMRKEAAGETPRRAINMMAEAIRTQLDKLTKAIEAAPNDQKQALENRRDTLREMQVAVGKKIDRISDLKAAGYAPLMRFGDYAVDVTDPEGKRMFFGLYESQAEANKAARKFTEQGLMVTQSVMSKTSQEALQGLSPETAMLFAEMLGVEKNEAMQAWLKNAVAEQSALKRHIRRKGVEGFDDDASRTLAAFITSNARASSRALHSQRIEEAVQNVKQGDVQDEAREMVKYVNNPREEAQAIRSLLFMQYLGGSVASALVNMTQTFVQTFPYLAQYGGAGKAGKRVLAAMKQAVGKGVTSPELRAALKRAEDDGVIKPQEVFQLQAEASRGLGSNLYVRSIVAAWGSMFQLAEQYNRRVAFIAAYNTAKEEGNPDPFAFAENAVDETQGIFNKGNRPNWARGAVGSTLFVFKSFVINYLEFVKRLPPKERLLALGVLVMLSGVRGLPFMEDAEDIVDTVAQAMGYNWSTKAEMNAWLDNAIGQGASELLQQGFSAVTPFDVSQRLGMANLLPGTGILKKSEANKKDEVLEVFGVAGSAVNDALKGEFRPLAIRNIAKGISMAMTGEYEDTKGRKVTDVTMLDAALKAIGLQPSTVAQESREVSREYELNALHRAVKGEITEQWSRAAAEGDAEGVAKAREALAKWNATNPEARIVIRPQTIIGRVREMRKSRAERFIKSTPKERRQDVREALA